MVTIRDLPLHEASGPEQMALDEVMLESAANREVASIRFYRWTEPTLSLGYFQCAEDRRVRPPSAWVRRASGGAAILHHSPHELTYSLALPARAAMLPKGESWICRIHTAIRDWLILRGYPVRSVVCGEEQKLGEFLCFLHHTPGDLILNGSKVVGSAQRKLRGAILQHGTILLSQSELTPELPGLAMNGAQPIPIEELMAATKASLAKRFEWTLIRGDWTDDERRLARAIEAEKYRSPEWNDRR